MEKPPSYDGSGLVNLIAEIERRMTGTSVFPGLTDASVVPDSPSYVLVLFDGLGVAGLHHQDAGAFRASHVGSLDAPFPTTTSVSLATTATGLSPSQHAQVAHLSWYPDLGTVVNTLKWVSVGGDPVAYEYGSVLPRPNLWERLRVSGVEPITVQPGEFRGTPLTRVMYRGARFEGAWDTDDLVTATLALAAEPGRLIFTYVPFIDYSGHVFGQESLEFAEAMRLASDVWQRIAAGLAPGVALVGTADHGLMEVAESDKLVVRDPRFASLRFAGDPRGVHMWGDPGIMEELAEVVGGALVDPASLLGPAPTDEALSHVGMRLLLAPPGKVVIPKGFDKRLRCYHGGLMREEVEIPLLIG